MAQNRVRLKEQDLKKALETLNKECPNHIVVIEIDYPKVTLTSEDVRGSKVELVLRDDEHYMLPVRIKSEPL